MKKVPGEKRLLNTENADIAASFIVNVEFSPVRLSGNRPTALLSQDKNVANVPCPIILTGIIPYVVKEFWVGYGQYLPSSRRKV
jgi:hypothetical protein